MVQLVHPNYNWLVCQWLLSCYLAYESFCIYIASFPGSWKERGRREPGTDCTRMRKIIPAFQDYRIPSVHFLCHVGAVTSHPSCLHYYFLIGVLDRSQRAATARLTACDGYLSRQRSNPRSFTQWKSSQSWDRQLWKRCIIHTMMSAKQWPRS